MPHRYAYCSHENIFLWETERVRHACHKRDLTRSAGGLCMSLTRSVRCGAPGPLRLLAGSSAKRRWVQSAPGLPAATVPFPVRSAYTQSSTAILMPHSPLWSRPRPDVLSGPREHEVEGDTIVGTRGPPRSDSGVKEADTCLPASVLFAPLLCGAARRVAS